MKILAIVRTNLVRSLRDRLALFFSVLLPLILILVLGLTFGAGNSVRIGVVNLDDGSMGVALLDAVSSTAGVPVDVRAFSSEADVRDAASRGVVSVALVIPTDYTSSIEAGGRASVTVVTPPTQRASAVRTMIDEAIAREVGVVRAAQWLAATTGTPFGDALATARSRVDGVAGVDVDVIAVRAGATAGGGYGAGAQSQLVLFMFLTSLTGAVELVLSRQLGVSRRMFSTPTGAWTIIAGESLARIAFALAQGLFIVGASALLFGVAWGDPVAVATILLAFGLVAGGASMVVGSVASTPSQAGALGPALGMLLGLLGGAMVPLELFPPAMQTMARLTPHAWAMDALGAVVDGGAGVAEVVPQLAVLLAFAAVFFTVAVTRFRRVLVGGG